MSELSKKAAYIKGLADGLDLEADSSEGKIITQLVALVGEMADEIEELQNQVDDMDELDFAAPLFRPP